MSAAKKGKKFTPQHIANMSAVRKGVPIPMPTRIKIGESLKGRRLPPESIEKVAEHHRIRILCVDTGVVFRSVTETSKAMGIDAASIVKVCKGKRPVAGGHTFRYATPGR